jgi:hypothetical protein
MPPRALSTDTGGQFASEVLDARRYTLNAEQISFLRRIADKATRVSLLENSHEKW